MNRRMHPALRASFRPDLPTDHLAEAACRLALMRPDECAALVAILQEVRRNPGAGEAVWQLAIARIEDDTMRARFERALLASRDDHESKLPH